MYCTAASSECSDDVHREMQPSAADRLQRITTTTTLCCYVGHIILILITISIVNTTAITTTTSAVSGRIGGSGEVNVI